MNGRAVIRARHHARRAALQALYQLQINPRPWQDVYQQYATDPQASRADLEYFRSLLMGISEQTGELDAFAARFGQILPNDLDPVERAVLWLGLHELLSHPELPYRVILDEAVKLARRFGATDGHKYVNAVLDRAAREMRSTEYGAAS
ncbi:MAG: transcription antitermination factor NusB [Proteobacteria bacterium]|nr:transcription antitermination factor NusB [Pseudomonadota bacterium]